MFDLTFSPSVHTTFSQFETVLGHCMKKIGKDDNLHAMDYGRKVVTLLQITFWQRLE